jgi:hypothetical protein
MRRQAKKLKRPYPATAEIPDIGLTLFGADWAKSYRLARAGVIETIAAGPRRRLAAIHPTCAKLGIKPAD